MSTRLAIIFIDALPHRLVGHLTAEAIRWSPMRAGIGYSINAKAELFAGLSPDRLGLLNEFSFREHPGTNHWSWLRPIDRYPTASWLLRRGLRKVRGGQVDNIPFAQRHLFERVGETAYERAFPHPTVLDDVDVVVRYSECARGSDRDGTVAVELRRALDRGVHTVFAAFPDLDRDLHGGGLSGRHLGEKLKFYDHLIREVCDRARDVVVVSDHGMSDVERLIDVWRPAEAMASRTDAAFFIDSTMLRIWGDPIAGAEVAMMAGLHVLDDDERTRYDVTSRTFGDVIAIAPEGTVLSPNSYGRVRGFSPGKLAMHGYHPATDAQVGVLGLSAGPAMQLDGWVIRGGEVRTLDVFDLLGALIRRDG